MKALLQHAARRLLWALGLIAFITTISFVVARLLPGDPARMMLGPQASAADVQRAQRIYGLDQGIGTQYARYWLRLVHRAPEASLAGDHRSCAGPWLGLHVDLGYSFHHRKPVVALLASRVPRSIELALAAMLVQLTLGLGLGLISGAKRGSRWDEAAIGASLLGQSAPTFLVGLLLQYVFAYKLGVLPFDGRAEEGAAHLRSLVLPALTLGLFSSAIYARIVRDETATLLAQDFVRTARAKGASHPRVLVVHVLRNALVPIATMAALDLGTMVGGAVVTERIFRWPGVGQLAVEAVLNRDGPVIFGTVLFTSSAVIVSMLALDVVLWMLDPRSARR